MKKLKTSKERCTYEFIKLKMCPSFYTYYMMFLILFQGGTNIQPILSQDSNVYQLGPCTPLSFCVDDSSLACHVTSMLLLRQPFIWTIPCSANGHISHEFLSQFTKRIYSYSYTHESGLVSSTEMTLCLSLFPSHEESQIAHIGKNGMTI